MDSRSMGDIENRVNNRDELDTNTEIIINENNIVEVIQNDVVAAQDEPKRYFIMEPAIFLANIASSLISTIFINLLLYQSCRGVYHYNATACEPMLGLNSSLQTAENIENEVQPYAANIVLAQSLINGIIPAILSLFMGTWSDKFGRRPILLASLSGSFISAIITTIMAGVGMNSFFSPWLYLISSIPIILTAGSCSLFTATYSYISDVANPQFKAKRMVFNDAASGLGSVVGSLLSSVIFGGTSFAVVFGIAAAFYLVALIYVFILIHDKVKEEYSDMSILIKTREFFRIDLIVDLMSTCVKRRPRYDRGIIWMAMLCLALSTFISDGESDVMYLFTRKRLNWSVSDYSTYSGISGGIQTIGSIGGLIILRKIFNFKIATIAILASISSMANSIVRSCVAYLWEMYLGAGLGIFSSLISPMSQSVISHMMPSNEVGTIFALQVSLGTIAQLIGSPVYTAVYDATLATNPGAFNIISACLYLLCIMLYAIIYIIEARHKVAYEKIIT